MKEQAHQRYKTKDSVIVPSVTTIINLLNKPALVPWANKLGLQGIDVAKYVDKLADVGTLAHQMILDYFKNQKTDFSEYSKEIIDKAENSFLSFLEWIRGKKIVPTFIEKSGVSDGWGFGGTFDFYGIIDKVFTLIDFKTGSGIYPEMSIQLAAYKTLLEYDYETPYKVEQAMILRVPRTEDEKFEIKVWTNLDKQWEVFKRLLEIYQLQKEIKEEM
jgi:hypothetical protein